MNRSRQNTSADGSANRSESAQQAGQQCLDLGFLSESGESSGPASPPADSDRERHLRAAWRLSRSMWRYRERSAEETRAGLAICHHLRALLEESEPRR